MIISMQRIKDINWFFLMILLMKILKTDWTRGTPGHIQPKVIASDAAFHR